MKCYNRNLYYYLFSGYNLEYDPFHHFYLSIISNGFYEYHKTRGNKILYLFEQIIFSVVIQSTAQNSVMHMIDKFT